MADKYDDAIEYLTDNPGQIETAWNDPRDEPGGCLFLFVTPDGGDSRSLQRPDGRYCGCLTQIRGRTFGHTVSWWSSLTHAIRNDTRIPMTTCDITVEDLPVFADWQRHIDTLREDN